MCWSCVTELVVCFCFFNEMIFIWFSFPVRTKGCRKSENVTPIISSETLIEPVHQALTCFRINLLFIGFLFKATALLIHSEPHHVSLPHTQSFLWQYSLMLTECKSHFSLFHQAQGFNVQWAMQASAATPIYTLGLGLRPLQIHTESWLWHVALPHW